jgi:hypothetical protein
MRVEKQKEGKEIGEKSTLYIVGENSIDSP